MGMVDQPAPARAVCVCTMGGESLKPVEGARAAWLTDIATPSQTEAEISAARRHGRIGMIWRSLLVSGAMAFWFLKCTRAGFLDCPFPFYSSFLSHC
jgi:hypothetical protein